jgi:hypothetical protein
MLDPDPYLINPDPQPWWKVLFCINLGIKTTQIKFLSLGQVEVKEGPFDFFLAAELVLYGGGNFFQMRHLGY